MGLKLGKSKKKEEGKTKLRAGKNNPRNVGSTVSLNEAGAGGVNTAPNAYEKSSPLAAGNSSRSKTMPRPGGAPGPTANRPKLQVIKAMYDYTARYDDDLGFKKGDRMEVISKGDDADWWLVRNIKTDCEGFVPSNYVVADDNTIETQEWWFGSDRREANKQLMLPGNPIGTYLIRNSKEKNSYALSVLDRNAAGDLIIKHYLIRPFDNGGFFIQDKKKFDNLIELVDFYAAESGVLKCRLTKPCPKQAMAVPFKELEVRRKDIVTGEKLGAGNFGEVHAGTFRNVVDVAVKSLKPGSMTNVEFLAEAEIMHRLRHPKLVQLMGICTEGNPLLIITERMSHGALIDVLRKDRGQTVKFSTMVDMAAQVSDGMCYLESQNYIHRDLRAANILVANNFVVKVADFGLARILDGIYEGDDDIYTANEKSKFPVKWTAPEAAREFKFSIKSDVWSFGVLLYELVTYGRIPYADLDNMTTLTKVCEGYRMENPQSDSITCPPQFYDIMLTCWDARPEKRPTFEYLKNVFADFPVFCEGRYIEEDG